MIYGQERAKPAEWWYLWCSKDCARVHHPDLQDVESFARLEFFADRIGWTAEEIARHDLACLCCGKQLD